MRTALRYLSFLPLSIGLLSAQQRPVLASVTPQNSAPAGSVLWQDPHEGAFSVRLPAGWQITGGTMRKTRIEPHYVIRAQSPDGGVQLFMDDPDLMIHEVPDRRLMMLGIREGARVPAGWGGTILVDRFRPGADAAGVYARKVCPSAANITGGRINDQTQAVNANLGPVAAAEGKRLYADAGEVEFRCGARLGYVQAVTLEVSDQTGITLWLVYRLAGYLARPESSASASLATHTALATFQMNQAWLASFARESGDIANNVIRESNAVTQAVMQRAKAEQAAAEAASAHRAAEAKASAAARQKQSDSNGSNYNAQLGTKTVCDNLDRCQTVDASVTNWWSDCSGTFHPGAESGAAPPPSESSCWSKGH